MKFKPDVQKAQEARKAKAQWAKENLQLEYEDDEHWKELSKLYGFRLPIYNIPNTSTKYLKRLLTKHGIDVQEYLESCGVSSIKELISLNPKYTARAECGFALEYINDRGNIPVKSI